MQFKMVRGLQVKDRAYACSAPFDAGSNLELLWIAEGFCEPRQKRQDLRFMRAEPMPDSSTSQTAGVGDDATARLGHIWQELLGLDTIGPDQNFFDLGGDSSVAVHLFA